MMVEILDRKDLEVWLRNKPVMIAQTFAVRAGLRVLPLTNTRDGRLNFTLVALRALFSSWVLGTAGKVDDGYKGRTAEAAYAARNAARTVDETYSPGPGRAIRAAARAADAADATPAATIARAADAAAASAAAVLGSAAMNPLMMWQNLSTDAKLLDIAIERKALGHQALWPPITLGPITRHWHDLKATMIAQDLAWTVWIEWYERRLTGEELGWNIDPALHEALCVGLATENNTFWEQPLAKLNAAIYARVEAARLPTPTTPARQSASVKPIWRNEKLFQDDDISSAAQTEALEDMLEGIGDDFAALAETLRGAANIAGSALTLLTVTAQQITSGGISRKKLFRLTNRLLEMQLYSLTVQAEWSPENGVRFHALTIQLDNLLRTFPDIREFMASVPRPERSLEEVKALEAAGEQVAEGLRSEVAAVVVDSSIVEAVQDSNNAVLEDLAPWIADLTSNRRRSLGSVENMLGGHSNILGELADRAIKSLNIKAGEHADKAGEYATNVAVYIYKRLKMTGKAGAVGTATTTATAAMTHAEILAQSSLAMGALMALLAYIYLSHTSSDKNKQP